VKSIIVIGAGGYAQEIAWLIDDINGVEPTWNLIGYIDPGAPQQREQMLYDHEILGGYDEITGRDDLHFACGIGNPAVRRKECGEAEKRGLLPATLIHPSVIRAKHTRIGAGSVIGAGCIVAPYAEIGRHCALNLQVTVGHNSVIGDFSVLSPGVRISGNAKLAAEVFFGNNASVFSGRRVGAGATLAANSFLLTDLAPGRSAVGIPAVPFGAATGAGICTTQEQKQKTLLQTQ
jgi:sugar O-acyltransferase (sialic acid O-acetyltransferase NeuD family)